MPGKLNLGADMLSRSNVPSDKWTQRSTFSPQKTTLIAKRIFRRTGMRWPTTGQTSSFMFSPDRPDPAGNQANQGTEAQSSVSGPALEEPSLVLTAAPWPITSTSISKDRPKTKAWLHTQSALESVQSGGDNSLGTSSFGAKPGVGLGDMA